MRPLTYNVNLDTPQVYQVEFPERPGALRRFLDAVSPTWNVTLFHYRSTGNRTTTVLVGLQVGLLCVLVVVWGGEVSLHGVASEAMGGDPFSTPAP